MIPYSPMRPAEVARQSGPAYKRQERALIDGDNYGALLDVLVAAGGNVADSLGRKIRSSDQIPIPHWAVLALLPLVQAQVKKSKGRGQGLIDAMIHSDRYEAVEECRDYGFPMVPPSAQSEMTTSTGDPRRVRCPQCGDANQGFDGYSGDKTTRGWKPWVCGPCDRHWRPTDSCFDKAAELLSGTRAAGTPATVRASWLKVKRTMRGGQGFRFYRPHYVTWSGRQV